jgi:nitrilase
VAPNGEVNAGPVRHEETILTAELVLDVVPAAGRLFDPWATTTGRTCSRGPADPRARAAATVDTGPLDPFAA